MPFRATGRATAVVMALLAAVVAACDSADSSGVPPPTPSAFASTTPSASGTSAAQAERAAVEAAYRRFWAVSWEVDKQPASRWRPVLSTVSVDPLLTRLYAGTKAQQQAGIRLYGQVLPRPVVGRVTGGRANVRDCQDASQAGQADARTGARKTIGVARTPVSASLMRGADGAWRVSDVRYTGGTC